jgi:hypothetical protein
MHMALTNRLLVPFKHCDQMNTQLFHTMQTY